MSLDLSVVDFGLALTAPDLAENAEALGYKRYWLGEHHGPEQAGSPLLRVALVAGSTTTIRVGTAGVCLRYHSPLIVAEDAMLNGAMFRGRIDLGVCNGAAARTAVIPTLLDGRDPRLARGFADKAGEVHALLHRRLPPEHPLFWHQARLEYGAPPQYWIMGATETTAQLAATLGAHFAFSEHHSAAGADGPAIARCYRTAFEAHHARTPPSVAILISGFCTDDRAQAQRLATKALGSPPPTGAIAMPLAMVGSRDDCADYLHAAAHRYGDGTELAILDCFFQLPSASWEYAQRERMLELVAEIGGLASRSRDSPTMSDSDADHSYSQGSAVG